MGSEAVGDRPFAPETLGLRVTPEGTNILVQGPAFQMLLPMASDWEYYPPTWDYEHGLLRSSDTWRTHEAAIEAFCAVC